MSKRGFISVASIKKIISATNRIRKENYNSELIKLQRTNQKECLPYYTLMKVDFDHVSRVTRIEILETRKYRTIQRYITQNYQKYPIYSEWKTKEKTIKKVLKLTNSELETLNLNNDELIRKFSEEIILLLNDENLFPSWFVKLYLKKELDSNFENMSKELKLVTDEQNKNIFNQKLNIYNDNIDVSKNSASLLLLQKKKDKLELKLTKILTTKNSILKMLFTFGLYYFFISDKRRDKIKRKLYECNEKISNVSKDNLKLQKNINECKKIIADCNLSIDKKKEEYENQKLALLSEYDKKIAKVRPLSNTISKDNSFVMLKNFSGLEYKKIIGVYIIHNKENDKYYVGQSKDVMRRIKQHFNGTMPKNIIFAEDYYSSKFEDRSNIFELKIIECKTKDELDALEKKLIYEYDSWNSGYNGTSGNI